MPPDAPAAASLEPAEPWRSFLRTLDAQLQGRIELRCLGGFVVAEYYGVGRGTADIDFLSVSGSREDDIERLAGMGSDLQRKHRVYVQYVGIVTPPSGYEARLIQMFPSAPWKRLALWALDPTDLALSKLERNAERDREDFLGLVRAGLVDPAIFKARYLEELRPYLLDKLSWHDNTAELWVSMANAALSKALPSS